MGGWGWAEQKGQACPVNLHLYPTPLSTTHLFSPFFPINVFKYKDSTTHMYREPANNRAEDRRLLGALELSGGPVASKMGRGSREPRAHGENRGTCSRALNAPFRAFPMIPVKLRPAFHGPTGTAYFINFHYFFPYEGYIAKPCILLRNLSLLVRRFKNN